MATPVPDKPTTTTRFRRRFRGYDSGAVDAFVRHVCRQLDDATAEINRLNSQIEDLTSSVAQYEDRGQALQDAMVTVESLRRQAVDAASQEAERIRQDASEEAKRILDEAQAESDRVRADADEVRAEVQKLKEEAANEVEAIEQGAREHAESVAADIEREAHAKAQRLSDEAQDRLQELAAQVERLEQRKAEFVAFLAYELGSEDETSEGPDSIEVGPLDVRFRRDGDEAERSSA